MDPCHPPRLHRYLLQLRLLMLLLSLLLLLLLWFPLLPPLMTFALSFSFAFEWGDPLSCEAFEGLTRPLRALQCHEWGL